MRAMREAAGHVRDTGVGEEERVERKSAMRRLTDEERVALREIGEPGEGPIPDAVFDECIRLGWGFWDSEGFWHVTAAGRKALELDDAAIAS